MDQKIYGTQHWDTCPTKHVKKNMLEKKFEVSGFVDSECNGIYKLKTDWNILPNGIIYENQNSNWLKFESAPKFGGWRLCHYINISDERYDNTKIPNSGWTLGTDTWNGTPAIIDNNITISEI